MCVCVVWVRVCDRALFRVARPLRRRSTAPLSRIGGCGGDSSDGVDCATRVCVRACGCTQSLQAMQPPSPPPLPMLRCRCCRPAVSQSASPENCRKSPSIITYERSAHVHTHTHPPLARALPQLTYTRMCRPPPPLCSVANCAAIHTCCTARARWRCRLTGLYEYERMRALRVRTRTCMRACMRARVLHSFGRTRACALGCVCVVQQQRR